jgi:hypothetical protein
MTLRRPGNFINPASVVSQRDRTSAVTIFSFLAFFLGLADRSAAGSKRNQQLTPDYETVSSAAVCCTGSIHFLRLRLIIS